MRFSPPFADQSPFSKILISIVVTVIFAFAFSLLSLVICSLVYGVKLADFMDLMNHLDDPAMLPSPKLMQTISSIGTFILPPIFLAILFDGRPARYLQLSSKPKIMSFLILGLLMLATIPIINWLSEINSHLALPSFLSSVEKWMKSSEEQAAKLTDVFLNLNSFGELLFALFMIALIPAIGEEFLFRGLLQKLLTQWMKNNHVAIFTTAALFSAMHMQFYGFVPRMFLGVILGYSVLWSGSLWISITGHFINNALAVTFTYLAKHDKISFDPDKLGSDSSQWYALVISIIISGILVLWLKKTGSNHKSVEVTPPTPLERGMFDM